MLRKLCAFIVHQFQRYFCAAINPYPANVENMVSS